MKKEDKQIIKMYFFILLFTIMPILILLYFFGNTKFTVSVYVIFELITLPFFTIYCFKNE